MGDGEKASLRLQFNPKVRLAFHGATITTDAGLLAFREFDDALGLTEIAEDYLQESRTGRNILHHLVPLLRQSIYSRLVLQRRIAKYVVLLFVFGCQQAIAVGSSHHVLKFQLFSNIALPRKPSL